MDAECGKDSAGNAARKGFRAERKGFRSVYGPERIPGRAERIPRGMRPGKDSGPSGFIWRRMPTQSRGHGTRRTCPACFKGACPRKVVGMALGAFCGGTEDRDHYAR